LFIQIGVEFQERSFAERGLMHIEVRMTASYRRWPTMPAFI